MPRRKHDNAAGGEDSSMDMMTALIGCLILILVGILMLLMIVQATTIIIEPDEENIRSKVLSNIDGMPDADAFPDGNKIMEPVFFDVTTSNVVIHGVLTNGPQVVNLWELNQPGGALEKELIRIQSTQFVTNNEAGEEIITWREYPVLLVRPYTARTSRMLRQIITEDAKLPIGIELKESDFVFNHRSATREINEGLR